jgi:hypothetical protein
MSFVVCQNARSAVSGEAAHRMPLRCWWCKIPINFSCGVPFASQFLIRPIARIALRPPSESVPTKAMVRGFANQEELIRSGQGFFVGDVDVDVDADDMDMDADTNGPGSVPLRPTLPPPECWIGKGIFCDLSCLLGLMTVEGYDVPLLGEYLQERGGCISELSEAVARPFPPLGYWPSPLLVSNSECVVKESRVSTYLMFGHTSSVTSDTLLSNPSSET